MSNNKNWRLKTPPCLEKRPEGAPRKYQTPEILWEACVKYFETIDTTPLIKRETTIY